MDKFSVLPTDEKFLNLYEEQKLAMFEGLCNLPDLKVVKKQVIIDGRIQGLKNMKLEEFGSPGLILKMQKTFESTGMPTEEVRSKIKEYLMRIRTAELKHLEKLKNE